MAANARDPPNAKLPTSEIPRHLWIAGIVLRALFIGAMLVVTARVSSPQSERIWSAYETPGDLVRMALGFALCLWIVLLLFRPPKDPEAYRIWVYIGLVAAPLALAVAIAVW
jgi:hypothetical protein